MLLLAYTAWRTFFNDDVSHIKVDGIPLHYRGIYRYRDC